MLFCCFPNIVEKEFHSWADKVTQPAPSPLNRQYIHDGVNDMPNIKIRTYVQALMKRGHTTNISKADMRKLRFKPYSNPGAAARPHIIDEYFIKELKLGRIYRTTADKLLVATPLFLKDERDKVRVIPDFSHPKDGTSINSLITDDDATVELPTMYDMIRFANDATWMGKNDGKSFYRQIPLCTDDFPIMGYIWRGKVLQESRMAWGTRNATKSAHYLSLAVAFIAMRRVPPHIPLKYPWILNYIDDHAIRGDTRLQCAYAHLLYIDTCTRAGMELKPCKTILVAQELTLLGVDIKLNEAPKRVAIEPHKLAKIRGLLNHLIDARGETINAADLRTLNGNLQYIAPLAWPLKCYMRELINALPPHYHPGQTLLVSDSVVQTCQSWVTGLELVQSTPMYTILNEPQIDVIVESDGSDYGYGAIWYTTANDNATNRVHWLFDAYHEAEVEANNKHNIIDRELYPIAAVMSAMGPHFTGMNVKFKTDNKPTEAALINKDIRRASAHEILIYMCEQAIKYKFQFFGEYLEGYKNEYADALSRLEINKFKRLAEVNKLAIDPAPTLFQRPLVRLGGTQNAQYNSVVYRD